MRRELTAISEKEILDLVTRVALQLSAQETQVRKMAMEKHIAANILAASTRCIGNKVYGNMLLGIPGEKKQVKEAIEYLQAIADVIVEEAE